MLFLQQIGHHGSIQQCGAASFSSTEKLLQQRQRMRVASGRRMRPCNGGCPVHARRRRASSKESCTRSGRRDATRYPPHRAGTLRLLALALSAATARAACKAVTLDFLLLDGNSVHAAIEDDIRADLAVIGIDVVSRAVDRETFNADMVAGNYDMVFSETWGAPYDPHSFVASWTTPDEAHYSALPTAGIDTTQFAADVADILSESDAEARQAKWTTLLSSIHDEVIHLPLFGRRIPSVTTRSRLAGYAPGYQQFDYPIHKATVVSGSKTVTVAPGAQAGLFTSVGRLDPNSSLKNTPQIQKFNAKARILNSS